MDEVLSKRQGCQGVGSRAAAAARSKRIVLGLAGVGVFFFLFVLCYTTWTISLRTNLQAANKTTTTDGLLANNDTTGPDTISNITNKPDGVDLSPTVPVLIETTYPLNETVRLTTPRVQGGRRKSGRIKMRKSYRMQIHQLLSKLLGNARVGNEENDENDRTNARNGTDKKTKKKSGRPKYRVVLPGRRRKKNRNAHRKTSPQRPPGSTPRRKKGRNRLKGDRKSRPRVPGCKKKGECPIGKTQNETDVKGDNASVPSRTRDRHPEIKGNVNTGTRRHEKGVKRTNITTESNLDERDSDMFNLTTQTSTVDFGTGRGSRLNQTSNKNSGRINHGDDLKQTEDQCPGDGDQSQEKDSKAIGSQENNSSGSEPCLVATCNGSDANVNLDGKLEGTKLETQLSDRENSNAEKVDEAVVTEDIDEEGDSKAGEKDYEYEGEEEGWKSNMETVFAEFDREKADEQRNALSQVNWNQSQESDTCDLWIRCKYNSLRHYLKQLEELPGCPCIYPNLVWNNQLWDDSKESYFSWETANSPVDRSDIYKPGAKFCIRSLLEPGMITLAAQHCCYDNNQQLITRGKAAGTPNLISPQISWELHRKVDILPWIICKGDWYRYHKVVPPNNSVMCKSNPEDTEFYRQVLDLKNI